MVEFCLEVLSGRGLSYLTSVIIRRTFCDLMVWSKFLTSLILQDYPSFLSWGAEDCEEGLEDPEDQGKAGLERLNLDSKMRYIFLEEDC